MEKMELVMIVAPFMGHFPQSIELAKMMLQKADHLSITVLVMKSRLDPVGTTKVEALTASCKVDRLHFRDLPVADKSQLKGIFADEEFRKSNVREIVSKIKGFGGILIDMINSDMMDVADELGVPSYIFFTCGAACLGIMLHLQAIQDEQSVNVCHLHQSETKTKKLAIPCFANDVPVRVLPTFTYDDRIWTDRFLKVSRDYRRARGIIINTFAEFESHAVDSLLMKCGYGKASREVPNIYPVGPILNRPQVQTDSDKNDSELMNWLDDQPEESVLYLSFGSMASFALDQVKEIALGLERSGCRFIWVLRQPPAEKAGFPWEFEDPKLALPEGFLDRTASIGKVVSWAPQFAALSHPAVGGFVSHCGWNSVLESIWCGVPITTLPYFGEQQLNAFQLVKEFGIGVEISLDHSRAREHQELVKAEEIEKGIREVMDGENEVRKKVKELGEKSRQAIKEGGSSWVAFEDLMHAITAAASVECPKPAS